ncbi:TPA: hypothetical protein MAA32_004895 [Klebsiella pneumoniae]|uniref:hypothetical protein n=1 Tax=Klebsiella pneumoniae TaxID=573 RepID=UPI001FF84E8E|nr:hypothetical protein [Klebsiella pneumoniae]MCJ6790484.1 hypothetical protein [Klebsiella pneumoniae]UPF69792.1 hypothetical protein LMH52_27700 [Klebsiella pneumoniae subsp. pneumoniae]HBS0521287.1 hypothetical protein [Klebsiella pneumoniae]HBS2311025.1 hypothetical protein [Klebsiella pneumoniae]
MKQTIIFSFKVIILYFMKLAGLAALGLILVYFFLNGLLYLSSLVMRSSVQYVTWYQVWDMFAELFKHVAPWLPVIFLASLALSVAFSLIMKVGTVKKIKQ